MRSLEKGLLLAELIDPSLTSKEQIDELVDWIRKQDSYIKLVESMMEIKKSSTFLATIIYREFSLIDLDKVKSIEEGLIAYSKILYLSQIALPNFYVNPLLVLNEKERKIPLGEVLVNFNEKYITLDELSLDTSFSFNDKYDFINQKVSEWEDEVFNKIISPLKELNKKNNRNLPIIRVFPVIFLSVLFLSLAEILVVVFLYFFGSKKIEDLLFHLNFSTYLEVNYFMLIALALLGINILIILFIILFRLIKFHKYRKARRIIINNEGNVSDAVNKAGDKLSIYIIKSFEKHEIMKKDVFSFSSCYYIFDYIAYLYYVNYKCEKIKDYSMTKPLKVLFFLSQIFFIMFIVLLIFRMI